MGDESQEAKVAVAVNDIEWLKESQRSTNRGIEQLQDTLTQYMKEQNERAEKFATKEEVQTVKNEVDKVKARMYWFGGIATALVVVFEYGKQWFGGAVH